MMVAIEDMGLVDGFSMGSRNNAGMAVSYLLFADATLIFCGANGEHIRNLRYHFLCAGVIMLTERELIFYSRGC
jgi:hypothetical protein